jgi:histidinol-phosphate aminotransferase
MTPLAERIQHTIRQDVQSMHAYAIQDSAGLIKLDAMENPFTPAARAAARAGRAAGSGGDQPLSGAEHGDDLVAALRPVRRAAGGLQLMLGNGSDELIDLLRWPATCPARRSWRRCPAS